MVQLQRGCTYRVSSSMGEQWCGGFIFDAISCSPRLKYRKYYEFLSPLSYKEPRHG